MFEFGRADLLTIERERAITEAVRTRQLLRAAERPADASDGPPSSRARLGTFGPSPRTVTSER